jgi:hypothetical protein
MSQKTFSFTAGVVFLLVAILHVLRIALGWHVIVNVWTIPMWVSWIGVFIAGFLAFTGFTLASR